MRFEQLPRWAQVEAKECIEPYYKGDPDGLQAYLDDKEDFQLEDISEEQDGSAWTVIW